MVFDQIKDMSLEEIKDVYTDWLQGEGLSRGTIQASRSDAFYLLRYDDSLDFWGMLQSENFEEIAYYHLQRTLSARSKGNVDANINSYMAHLRRFQRFLFSDAEHLGKKPLKEAAKCDIQLQKPKMAIEELRNALERYILVIKTDDHGRYLSWEHCFGYFSKHRHTPTDDELDLMCLHLAWYLASWGMLRGSAFLLQKDYRIHLPVVKLLVSPKCSVLYDCSLEDFCSASIQKLLSEVSAEIIEIYRALTDDIGDGKGKTASDTLITKILLGTTGCVPAYDRYFKSGLAVSHVAQQRYGAKSLCQLARFYLDNETLFEPLRKEISKERIEYTPMKMLDMCFWQIGFDHDPKRTSLKQELLDTELESMFSEV